MVEILVDSIAGKLRGAKPFELRVVLVSPSRPHQDLTREKSFSPKGDEAL
jgi:hypothetical protein